jgi:hypothetical protein
LGVLIEHVIYSHKTDSIIITKCPFVYKSKKSTVVFSGFFVLRDFGGGRDGGAESDGMSLRRDRTERLGGGAGFD